MKRSLALALIALAGVVGARAEWPHINPKLAGKTVVVRKAVLLPVLITFSKLGTKGSEGGVEEGEAIAAVLYATVSKELASRGVEVLPNPLETAKDDSAKYAVADVQAKYDNVAVQLRRKPARVEKGAYTLGDGVTKFAPGAAADVLVFVRGLGSGATTGRAAIDIATRWVPENLFQGEIVLVDAKSGEVLFFVRFDHYRNVATKTEERLAQSVHRVMHDMPLPLPPPKD